jgi:hypothetical protein
MCSSHDASDWSTASHQPIETRLFYLEGFLIEGTHLRMPLIGRQLLIEANLDAAHIGGAHRCHGEKAMLPFT